MRKQFNLQDWLKDKSQKVETRDGRPVKIISFEMTDTNDCPIAAQFRLCAGTPVVYLFDKEGHYKGEGDSDYDLFIVTPNQELTAFEKAIEGCIKYTCIGQTDVAAKRWAAKLLDLAEREIVNRVAKECYKDDFCIEDTVKFNEGYKLGKEVALKDLPRWKKFAPNINNPLSEQQICKELENSVMRVDDEGYCWIISRKELNKLPKEDSHE